MYKSITTMVKQTNTTVSADSTAPEKKKRTSSKKEVVSTPVSAPQPIQPQEDTTQGGDAVEKTDVSSEINDDIAELMKNIQARSSLDAAIKASVKSLEKKITRMTKLLDKTNRKKKTSQNKVSGFEKPTGISDELAKFVGVDVGTELARTAVSKKIHEYVKQNDLQNPDNRRIINPDAKLRKLLRTSTTEEVSYFNLQKFLKVHFKKSTA